MDRKARSSGTPRFLAGEQILKKIKEITVGKNVRCAVAFWGSGSKELFPSSQTAKPKIICNLQMGGTNPDTIREFIDNKFEVKQRNTLHAKVYISDCGAVVTSANASVNGLGLESSELSGWDEAGYWIPPEKTDPIRDWFDRLWEEGDPISKIDIKKAKENWSKRRNNRPALPQGGRTKSTGKSTEQTLSNIIDNTPGLLNDRDLYVIYTTSEPTKKEKEFAKKGLPKELEKYSEESPWYIENSKKSLKFDCYKPDAITIFCLVSETKKGGKKLIEVDKLFYKNGNENGEPIHKEFEKEIYIYVFPQEHIDLGGIKISFESGDAKKIGGLLRAYLRRANLSKEEREDGWVRLDKLIEKVGNKLKATRP